ncbi:MAG TPA: beta-ketoacyl synthase N-terminal-like domain-containing protein [Bryobacteraceae bacterium]|jgi:3-oxoacyl-[acyl-carrier-protein] synthase II|nr:beta-ketoacyl synthase N-terminal-like domain-containing protein [Bryobacteraceae bacterium]
MKIGVYGWGVVAPKSPNIEAFRKNLACSETWLTPFNGFGPDNFLVGTPEFRFDDYEQWISARFAPRHYQKLKEKMDLPAQYAIGAFIQSLEQNPGVEQIFKELGSQAQVYIGTGLGALDTTYKASIELYKSQKQWDAFWAVPERNSELRTNRTAHPCAPTESDTEEWNRYWMARSPELAEYLAELAQIDGLSVGDGEIETAKLHAIREKDKRRTKLRDKWGAPEAPWNVSANLIWNIHNTPAAQVSILGKITGLAFAPVAACSTFGVALELAMRAIRSGDAKLVVVGATDPPPHPLTVGSFYNARVLSASRAPSVPLTGLQGTHIAGGSIVWLVADHDYMQAKGFKPVGMEPVAVGLSSDAYHIITPSADGPTAAIRQALASAGLTPDEIGTWDLHATATPGDYSEVTTMRSVLPGSVLVTARKGTFGHGMSAGCGWELTAQYLGYEQGKLFPTPLAAEDLNRNIQDIHDCYVFDTARDFPSKPGGKLAMGIGGINACIISSPW